MRKGYVALNKKFIDNKIAHRGLHSEQVSENSLQAFSLAIERGFAIEIDVHLLTDGEVAVVHDSNLARVTGQEVIVETLSSKDLYKYPLLKNGEKIPTLKETLALINGKVPLLIELKFENEFDEKLSTVSDLTELDAARVAYLGKKGSITALLKGMKDLSVEEKKTFGAEVNTLKEYATNKLEEKTAELKEKEIAAEIAAMAIAEEASVLDIVNGKI